MKTKLDKSISPTVGAHLYLVPLWSNAGCFVPVSHRSRSGRGEGNCPTQLYLARTGATCFRSHPRPMWGLSPTFIFVHSLDYMDRLPPIERMERYRLPCNFFGSQRRMNDPGFMSVLVIASYYCCSSFIAKLASMVEINGTLCRC